MKQRIFILILLSGVFFSSCQKSSVKPDVVAPVTQTKSSTPTVGSPVVGSVTSDSLSNINGYLRLQFAKDSINTDNVLVNFNPSAKTTYVPNEDAPTFQGFGQVSLSSFSSDNVPLAINTLPLTKKGISIGLRVNALTDGVYQFKLVTIKSIPSNFDVIVIDKYKKDSLDIRHNPGLLFNIIKADTASFGSNRFKLVVRLR